MTFIAKCGLALILTLLTAPAFGNEIYNSGFESSSTILAGYPPQPRVWGGDQASRTFAENGITPLAGDRMLRFEASGFFGPGQSSSSEFYQLIDVSASAPGGGAMVDVSFFANRVAGPDVDTRFFLRIYAYSGIPLDFEIQHVNEEYLQFDQVELLSDDDPETWEQLTLSATVPANATFLAMAIVANENVSNDEIDEFTGHYADEVFLDVTGALPVVESSWSRVKAAFWERPELQQ